MKCTQQRFWPDPQPLVERLGRDFFLQLPEVPGVYLMRDTEDCVVYVGKAKNLRKRLSSYRVANPDRMQRRHLRMLRAVMRIELQPCLDESAALAHEAELLRALRPKYNRAGTWPGRPRYLVWRQVGERLELSVTDTSEADWHVIGPLGRMALFLRNVLARLLWCSVNPELGPSRLPSGWIHGRFENVISITTGTRCEELLTALAQLFSIQPEKFVDWLRAKMSDGQHPFDKAAIEADLEFLVECFPKWSVHVLNGRCAVPGKAALATKEATSFEFDCNREER